MVFLFVAPRFHTNQVPTTKGLIEDGHRVEFLVQAVGGTESHEYVKPEQMELSFMGKIVSNYLKKKYDKPTYETKMLDKFIPKTSYLKRRIKEINPDVVILRDRDPSTIKAYRVCKKLGIKPVILYNQTGLYTNRTKKNNILKKIVFALCPKVRITISYINDLNELKHHKEDLYVKDHEYFIPYVGPLNEATETRTYLDGGVLNVIDIGKYRPYKNHYVFLRALEILRDRNQLKDIKFTLLGQAKVPEEEEYYEGIAKYVEEHNLDDILTLRKNAPYNEMKNIFQENDVFLLTSFAELASITIIEAMCNGIVPISSSFNGTACYIKEGENGFVFETNDEQSLADQIAYVSEHRDMVQTWGQNGYKFVKENCRYPNYKKVLSEVLEKEFGLKL